MTSLKTSSESLQKQTEDMISKLKEAKEQHASMEEKFRNELNANIKLSNLYKVCRTSLGFVLDSNG